MPMRRHGQSRARQRRLTTSKYLRGELRAGGIRSDPFVDVAAADGQHEYVFAGLAGGPPVGDHGVADLHAVGSGDEPPVGFERVEGHVDVPGS